jgi:hypothetical protein
MSGATTPDAPSAAAAVAVAVAAEDKELKVLTGEWKETMKELIAAIDNINKRSVELDRQKSLITAAISEGKVGPLEAERALVLQRSWADGVQVLPLYPTELARAELAVNASQAPLLLSPTHPRTTLNRFDEAGVGRRDWVRLIRLAAQQQSNTLPSTLEVQEVGFPYTVQNRAQWQVQTLPDLPEIPQPSPAVVSETVDKMMRQSRARFVPGAADAYGFSFRYKSLQPTAASSIVTTSQQTAFRTPNALDQFQPTPVQYVPANLPSGYYSFGAPLPATPIAPPVSSRKFYRANENSIGLESMTQRVYTASELPTLPEDSSYEDGPIY